MADIVSIFSETFRHSFSPKFYLYMALVFVLTIVLGMVSGVVALIVGGVLFVVALAVYGLMAFSLPALFIYFVLLVLFLLALFLVGAFVDAVSEGLGVNLVLDFLAGKKLDLSLAFKRLQPRLGDAVKVRFYLWVALGVIVLILLSLPLLFTLPWLPGLDLANIMYLEALAAPLAGLLIVELVLILLIALAVFLLSPYFVVLLPLPFFEKKGPRACLDRTIALVKKNYWQNMGFFLLYLAALTVIGLIIGGLSFVTGLFAGFMEVEALLPVMIVFFLFFTLVMFIVRLLFQVWIFGLTALFYTRVYFLNVNKKAGKPKDTKLKF
jgi:hypothetical protein